MDSGSRNLDGLYLINRMDVRFINISTIYRMTKLFIKIDELNTTLGKIQNEKTN